MCIRDRLGASSISFTVAPPKVSPHPFLGLLPRNVTVVRLLQFWKAPSPMLVTLTGIEMLVRLKQYTNETILYLCLDIDIVVSKL